MTRIQANHIGYIEYIKRQARINDPIYDVNKLRNYIQMILFVNINANYC